MIYAIGKFLAFFANKLYFNIKFVGTENIPQSQSCVICSNHHSMYDPVAIASKCHQKVHYLGKAELTRQNWFVRWIMKSVGMIPVERGNVSVTSLKKVMKVLKEDGTIGIFPEGTRVRGDKLRPEPLDGFVLFALKAKVPILPVHIEGNFKFRGKCTITFGKPFTLDEYYGKKIKGPELKAIGNQIMDDIYAMGTPALVPEKGF